jgi:transcriptional regulator with XRE-family HTH domain
MTMDVGRTLREARQAAGLTQRQLAARAGMPQSTVARIERGQMVPRVDTFDRLLRAAELRVGVQPVPGAGVDRTLIRRLLQLTPEQRLESAANDGNAINRLVRAAGRHGTT